MPNYIIRQRDWGQAKAKTSRPRPRPKLRGRGQNFGLGDLTSLVGYEIKMWLELWFVIWLLGSCSMAPLVLLRWIRAHRLCCIGTTRSHYHFGVLRDTAWKSSGWKSARLIENITRGLVGKGDVGNHVLCLMFYVYSAENWQLAVATSALCSENGWSSF